MVKFRIPGIAPSYNMSFKINYALRQTYLTNEAREFKKKAHVFCPPIAIRESELIILNIIVVQSWIYKNGKLRKKDVQNLDKLLIDALATKLGIDDSRVYCTQIRKVHSNTQEFVEVELSKIKREDWEKLQP